MAASWLQSTGMAAAGEFGMRNKKSRRAAPAIQFSSKPQQSGQPHEKLFGECQNLIIMLGFLALIQNPQTVLQHTVCGCLFWPVKGMIKCHCCGDYGIIGIKFVMNGSFAYLQLKETASRRYAANPAPACRLPDSEGRLIADNALRGHAGDRFATSINIHLWHLVR